MRHAPRTPLLVLLLLLLTFATGSIARADLANSLRVEETLRTRIEGVLQVYDPRAKAVLNFEYKRFDSELPGIAVAIDPSTSRQNMNAGDISRVNIEIFTTLAQLPPDARDMVYRLLPVTRDNVALKISKLPALAPEAQGPLDTVTFSTVLRSVFGESFSEGLSTNLKPALQDAMNAVAKQTLLTFTWILTGAVGGCLLILIAFSTVSNAKLLKEFRQHFSMLSSAISESSLGGGARPSRAESNDTQRSAVSLAPSGAPEQDRSFDELPLASLSELLADCYWCEQDGYAAWLWSRLSIEQRKGLLGSLPFMTDYCAYFINFTEKQATEHNHPYYLVPQTLASVSQEDLAALVRQKPGLWHHLSPIRQARLPLSLKEKIAALQAPPVKDSSAFAEAAKNARSTGRKLAIRPAWSDISVADEKSIFENPEAIPSEYRPHLKSLVWIALREPEVIKKALGRFDARALAEAWIGPEEVLRKLEEALPEKKRKLLANYRGKVQPDRRSEAFLALSEEGLHADNTAPSDSSDGKQDHEAA